MDSRGHSTILYVPPSSESMPLDTVLNGQRWRTNEAEQKSSSWTEIPGRFRLQSLWFFGEAWPVVDGHHFQFMAVASTGPAGEQNNSQPESRGVGRDWQKQWQRDSSGFISCIIMLCIDWPGENSRAMGGGQSHTNLFWQIIGHFPPKLPSRIFKELLPATRHRALMDWNGKERAGE